MIIFVDSSALYAILVESDEANVSAITHFDALLNDPAVRLVTSNYVVVETCSLLHNRFGVQAVQSLQAKILPGISVWWIDEAIHQSGLNAMLLASNNGPSLVDCTSFALMYAHGITHAFAFDRHFTAAGFTLPQR